MNKITSVRFTDDAITIFYNEDDTLHLYKAGGDLFDFDAFLTQLVADIDFELIDLKTARELESSLYSALLSCTTQKACFREIKLFTKQIQNRFSRKLIRKLIHTVLYSAQEKMKSQGLLSLKAKVKKAMPLGIITVKEKLKSY